MGLPSGEEGLFSVPGFCGYTVEHSNNKTNIRAYIKYFITRLAIII